MNKEQNYLSKPNQKEDFTCSEQSAFCSIQLERAVFIQVHRELISPFLMEYRDLASLPTFNKYKKSMYFLRLTIR